VVTQKGWRWFGAEFMKGNRAELEEDRSINRQKISSLGGTALTSPHFLPNYVPYIILPPAVSAVRHPLPNSYLISLLIGPPLV
jgi:hypothetical protein